MTAARHCAALDWNQHPMLFTQCPGTETALFGILSNGVKALGTGKKWGDLYCVESPDLCGKLDRLANDGGLAKRAGLEPVYRQGISLRQPDFTAECLKLRNAGVEAVSPFGDGNTLLRVARSCAQQNYRPLFLIGGTATPTSAPTSPGLENASIMTQTMPFTGLDVPAAREFDAAMKKYASDSPLSPSNAVGWVAGKLFEKAATSAGGDFSPSHLIRALTNMRGETLGGLPAPLTFLAGKPSPDSRCWFSMQASNGKWTAPRGARYSCW